VHELPAGDPDTLAVASGLLLAGAFAGDAMTSTADPPELFDVEMDELAGMLALVAVGRLKRVQPGAFAQPDSLQDG
jgi:hypothetical protein